MDYAQVAQKAEILNRLKTADIRRRGAGSRAPLTSFQKTAFRSRDDHQSNGIQSKGCMLNVTMCIERILFELI